MNEDPTKDQVLERLAAKDLAEDNTGLEVKMHSEECVAFKNDHEDCTECPSHEACAKMVYLRYACMKDEPEEKIEEVLEAKSASDIDIRTWGPTRLLGNTDRSLEEDGND